MHIAIIDTIVYNNDQIEYCEGSTQKLEWQNDHKKIFQQSNMYAASIEWTLKDLVRSVLICWSSKNLQTPTIVTTKIKWLIRV